MTKLNTNARINAQRSGTGQRSSTSTTTRHRIVGGIVATALLFTLGTGCAWSNKSQGAVIGAGAGAAAGAVVGNATGSTVRGAIIGAVVPEPAGRSRDLRGELTGHRGRDRHSADTLSAHYGGEASGTSGVSPPWPLPLICPGSHPFERYPPTALSANLDARITMSMVPAHAVSVECPSEQRAWQLILRRAS